MKILLVEQEQLPEVREIDGGLRTMQRLVGGVIQTPYPFEAPVALVCNDEGKLLGLPGNRALRNEQGKLYDIVCGTFFLCGAPPNSGRFISPTEGQAEKYRRKVRTFPHVYLSPEKMSCIFERFPEGSSSYLPILIGYKCGLRIPEAFGLTWNCIDLSAKP